MYREFSSLFVYQLTFFLSIYFESSLANFFFLPNKTCNNNKKYSGNKLYHLDGEILLKLPQLYAIHLAGSNPWRCDCHLRRLVRKLLIQKTNNNAPNNNAKNNSMQPATMAVKQQAPSVLQDDPRCFVEQPSSTTSTGKGLEGAQQLGVSDHQNSEISTTKSMRPNEPRFLESVQASPLGEWSKFWTNMSK